MNLSNKTISAKKESI